MSTCHLPAFQFSLFVKHSPQGLAFFAGGYSCYLHQIVCRLLNKLYLETGILSMISIGLSFSGIAAKVLIAKNMENKRLLIIISLQWCLLPKYSFQSKKMQREFSTILDTLVHYILWYTVV